ncbi:MAG: hypothetical protein JXK94_11935 [Deltaproteobacteria bacterium]|nr:hypothetical protein [Deltaproteobacteria bacterium]
MVKILSLGDCNTLGAGKCEGNAYPERFAMMLGAEICNCGFTMSTTREGGLFFRDFYDETTSIVTIQYGLVDSWETIAHAPYVLYYPDNIFRRIGRKIVKKYKKTCRQLGLNTLFKNAYVVPPAQYVRSINEIIDHCTSSTKIFLIETIPNRDAQRNPAIQKYNQLLKQIETSEPRCQLIKIYDYFLENQDSLYADDTHINAEGHEFIALQLLNACKGKGNTRNEQGA